MKLYITRHGETMWNLEGRLQGRDKDSKLTELGRKQASWLCESMRDVKYDIVYTSTLGRCIETTEILTKGREIEIVKRDSLREMSFGNWEGKEHKEVIKHYEYEYDLFWREPTKFVSPVNGESIFELKDRVITEMESIIENNKGKDILIVVHGIVLNVIMAHFKDQSLDKMFDPPYMKNTCLNVVEITDDKAEVLKYADISHYKE